MWGIALLATASRLPGLTPLLNDRDSWRQTDTASIAHNFLDEPNILYPRVFWGAPGPGYVEAEFQLYSYTVSLLYRVFGENPLYGRLLSLLLNAFACLVFFSIARRFLEDIPALLAVALFAFSPAIYIYSRAFMPESMALLFYLLALKSYLDFLDRESWPTILSSAVFMSLAILVKPTTIHIGLAFMIFSISKGGWRSLFRPHLLAFAAIAFLPNIAYYTHAVMLHLHYGNTFGVISGGDPKWGNLALWTRPKFYAKLVYIDEQYILGAAGSLLAILGFFVYRRAGWRQLLWPWILSTAIYYFIAGRYTSAPGRGLQYHIYAVACYALAASGGVVWLVRSAGRRLRILSVALVLLAFAQQGWQSAVLCRERYTSMLSAGSKLAQLSQPDDYILVLSRDVSIDKGVPNNYQQPDVFFYARRWGRSLARDRQTPKDLLSALAFQPKWYVSFPDAEEDAAAGFREEIARRMTLAAQGDEYAIYQIHSWNP
ncbi:MAG: glycosyltransferase family 39 protein [Candidatus Sumerlaeota bacterium]|nr:glycosyltransferase family 39 protein [Candidatus Sumerlaeota bacterium]